MSYPKLPLDNSITVSTRESISLSPDWRFLRLEAADERIDASGSTWDDSSCASVHLPHTPRIEAAAVQFPFQGICWYRKRVKALDTWRGKRVVLEFGAAMQIADVWVDGKHRLQHLGGYLPFSLDLTESLANGREVQIAVRLDNRDTDLCPPGKPIAELDFSYFGGLYRDVCLHITSPFHISDPLRVDCEAGGGIFVRCDNASDAGATLQIRTHALNESAQPLRKCRVVSEIFSPEGTLLHRETSFPLMVAASEGHTFVQTVELSRPALWHPDHPHLHTLVTRLFDNGVQTDEVTTRFGVRHVAIDKRFSLNGKEFAIRGANRHQEYPFIGNAVPKNAQRRDARKIKDAGFNYVRLSHYPQDPSFLDACDELGLLVQAAVPGWQQFHLNPSFVRQTFKDIRELIRRDRNHPSIVFWEPNLNETGVGEDGEGFSDWCRAAHEITHLEYPGPQCLTFGDDYPQKPGWGWDVKGLWREYGDFAFGGNESTSRHTRGEGERALLQQTWNFLWTYNHLNAKFKEPDTIYFGGAVWVMFDYNRGYYPKPCNCGMMDIFRLPKYVHYFYQSQRAPHLLRADVDSGPMVFLATDWTPRTGNTKVVVFSNCDEVELRLNGRTLARRKPDAGPDTVYSTRDETSLATVGNDYDSSGGNPFDGGNANNIPHPPFTFFDVPYAAGKLEAVAYLKGAVAATHAVSTPAAPHRLELSVDLAGVPLAKTEMDAVFIRARVVDNDGNLVPSAGFKIEFAVDAEVELIGPNPATPEAGIASLLLRTTRTNGTPLRIRATGGELPASVLVFKTESPA